jgi:hypothetical protein
MSEKTRVAADGLLEGYDPETGEVLWREKKKGVDPTRPKVRGYPRGRPRKADPSPTHVILDGNGRRVLAPKGTNPDVLPRAVWPFSQVTCDHILNLIADGNTITTIGLMEGLPTKNVIQSWLRDYPEFRQKMKIAREVRAESFHDKIVDLVDTVEEDTAKRDRVKLDALKWAAEVNNPEVYGKQTNVKGSVAAVQIIIETGVPRSVEISSEKVEDSK